MERLPTLVECSRLVLRQWHSTEAAALSAAVAASVEHLRPWMAWIAAEPLSLTDRRSLIEGWLNGWPEGGDVVFGVWSGDVVVGGCGLHRRSAPDTLDIGYWIHVDHLRKGYATELAAALTTAAFGVSGVERVAIHHDRANEASGRVPLRLGFSRDGETPAEIVAPGEVGVDVTWSIGRAEWSARSSDT